MRRLASAVAVLAFVAASAAAQIVIQSPTPRPAVPMGVGAPQPAVVAAACSESEPNEQPSSASPISIPGNCSGFASSTDASTVTINYGGGLTDGVEDLFVVNVGSSMRLNITLSWTDTSGDLDLFLFRPNGSTLDIVDGSNTNGSAPESITTGTLSAGTYYIGVSAFASSANYTLNVSQVTSTGCTQDTTTTCLNNGRFRVRATYDTGSSNGNGGAVRLTSDTGYFWFFGNANVEMVVKILDACSFNNRFWVFAGGLTDVGVSLNITDTQTGTTKTYSNPRGTAFKAIQDTDAFSTCGSGPSCSYGLSPSSQSFGAGGGSGSVAMSATSGCSWSATSDSSWLTITSGSGTGNGTINFNVASNGGGARTATISANGQTATVSQAAGTPSCSYVLSPSGTSYPTSGGSGTIGVSAAPGCAWNATATQFWITITSGSSGNGSGTVAYTVAANSGSARVGAINIAGQSVSITQAGTAPASYNGTWSGTTTQGKTFSFTIVNNAFTTWTLGWHAVGSCTVDGTTTVTYNTPLPLSGTSFNLSTSGPTTININGSFSSTSAAAGSLSVSFTQSFPSCSASGSGSWSATKP
jgi:hypothetical protein